MSFGQVFLIHLQSQHMYFKKPSKPSQGNDGVKRPDLGYLSGKTEKQKRPSCRDVSIL